MIVKLPIDKGYRPDYIPYQAAPGALAVCKNLLPYDNRYASMPQAVNYTAAATLINARAGVEYKDNTGVYRQFAGNLQDLYRLGTDKIWVKVTRLASIYGLGETIWNFTQYGEWVIATNYADEVQVLKGMTAANFEDLGGTPPQAKYVLLHSGHLILANLIEGATPYPRKLTWSAKEDVETFTPSLTTGADSQELADVDSEITGLASAGPAVIIGHENAISVGWYIGAPFTFRFEQAKFKNVGCIPNTMVSNGSEVFFMDDHDIYKTNGESLVSIGEGIRENLCEHINRAYSHRITTAVDPLKNIIYWLVPNTESEGTPNRMYCYNWKTDRWTYIEIEKECIFQMHAGATDPDSFAYLSDLVDQYIDSATWLANAPAIACIDPTGYLQTFMGEPMSGYLETYDFEDGNINLLRRIRPRINQSTGSVSGRAGYRFQENDGQSYTPEVAISADGFLDLFATGRYLRAGITTDAHSGIPLDMELDVVKTGGI